MGKRKVLDREFPPGNPEQWALPVTPLKGQRQGTAGWGGGSVNPSRPLSSCGTWDKPWGHGFLPSTMKKA